MQKQIIIPYSEYLDLIKHKDLVVGQNVAYEQKNAFGEVVITIRSNDQMVRELGEALERCGDDIKGLNNQILELNKRR